MFKDMRNSYLFVPVSSMSFSSYFMYLWTYLLCRTLAFPLRLYFYRLVLAGAHSTSNSFFCDLFNMTLQKNRVYHYYPPPFISFLVSTFALYKRTEMFNLLSSSFCSIQICTELHLFIHFFESVFKCSIVIFCNNVNAIFPKNAKSTILYRYYISKFQTIICKRLNWSLICLYLFFVLDTFLSPVSSKHLLYLVVETFISKSFTFYVDFGVCPWTLKNLKFLSVSWIFKMPNDEG